MDVRLEVVHDKSRVSNVPLRRDTVVGRGKECQLRIPVADVSRRHCQFTIDGERLLLQDLGSANGTQLAGRTIPAGTDVLISDGDTVTVGPVTFVIHISSADSTAGPAAQPSSLADTAEFPSFEHLADEVPDYVTDEPSVTPTPDANAHLIPDQPPGVSAEEMSADNALQDDDPVVDEEASIIDLEFGDVDDDQPGSVSPEFDPADEPSAEDDPEPIPEAQAEPPLKSRSLFGLFRRRPPAADGSDITDDDLMEEPGEDPPTDTPLPDDGIVGAAHQAQLDSVSFDDPPETPAAAELNDDSVFDDDISDDQLADTTAGLQPVLGSDSENIVDDDSDVEQNFIDDDSDDEAGESEDDNLMDFLGQFGD